MINVNIDISQVAGLLKLEDEINKAADQACQDLAQLISTRAKEIAAQKLKTRREMYQKGLKVLRVDENTHVVALDAKVRWIDDGQPAHDMLKDLLNSKKAKRAKDGSRYIVVPFSHSPGKGKTGSTAAQQDLIGAVKKELRTRGIPFGKIETDQAGKAKLGRLHSFDIMHAPTKSDPGKGQRRGPVGDVMQGNTKIPFLQGISVHQSMGKNGKVQRSIMTFRVASEKHSAQAKWEHPGNAPVAIMEEALKSALEMWSKEVAPAILDKILIEMK